MKKIVLSIVGLLAITGVINAQYEFNGRSVRLGFKFDPVLMNSLKPADNGIEKDGSKMGLNYGLMADINFRDSRGAFATGIEVIHAGAGLQYDDASQGLYRNNAANKQNYDLKLQYIQIPLTVKLRTNETHEGLHWWGQFGTYMGALIKSRVDADYAPNATAPAGAGKENNQNILNRTNKVNMGLMLGAGGQYTLSEKTDLFFGIGYENGFTDVTSNKDWKDGKVALNRLALRLGLFF